jgi:pilus assembly protein CpaE
MSASSHESTPGALLWATVAETDSRQLIETVGQEFGLRVRFCSPAELLGMARSEVWELAGVELGEPVAESLALIRELRRREPLLTIVAASADRSVPTIRAALEAGAHEFLSLPLDAPEVHKVFIKATQTSLRKEKLQGAPGEIITIHGVRGGLGATTLAVNLAVRLAKHSDASVSLVDLDLQRGDIAAFLNLNPSQSLAAIASARGDVDEVFLHGALTRHESGVIVLPAPLQMEEADTIGHEQVETALRVLRSQCRYVIVDTARTLTDASLAALEATQHVFLLTDLSVPSVRATRRTLDLLARLEARAQVLVTQSIAGPVKLEDATRAIGQPPYLIIPRDVVAASHAMNAGAPLNGTKDSPLATSIAEFAAKLTGVSSKSEGGRLFGRFFGRGKRV